MRYSQFVSDLTEISFATVIHDTRPADDFQVSDLGQLRQNVVLHTIGKRGVFLLLAQVFKWQYGNSSCHRMRDKFTLPNYPARSRCQSNQRCHQERTCWIPPHPFLPSAENSSVSRLNRFI